VPVLEQRKQGSGTVIAFTEGQLPLADDQEGFPGGMLDAGASHAPPPDRRGVARAAGDGVLLAWGGRTPAAAGGLSGRGSPFLLARARRFS
jgi:hypothetical protein